MANGDTPTTPAAPPGSTTAAPSPPKPTPADLRKSADQMRDMAKGTQQRAAEARTEEKRLEGEAQAADNELRSNLNAADKANVERETALARAEEWKKQAATRDEVGDHWREEASKAVEEADKLQASDPAKAADLREKAERFSRLASDTERQEQEARDAEATARADAKQWDARAEAHYTRIQEVSERRRALQTESERWEEKADEQAAIAKSQLEQAAQLDASAVNLEIESGVAPAPAAGALLEEQEDTALEVLGAVAPEGELEMAEAVALADTPELDGFASDPPASEDGGDGFAPDAGDIVAEEPLGDAMSADEVAMASLPEDDAMLGAELDETGGTELPDTAEAPADEMGDVEV